jgi:hypothetical protein
MLTNTYATIRQQIVLHHILLHFTSSNEISLLFFLFSSILMQRMHQKRMLGVRRSLNASYYLLQLSKHAQRMQHSDLGTHRSLWISQRQLENLGTEILSIFSSTDSFKRACVETYQVYTRVEIGTFVEPMSSLYILKKGNLEVPCLSPLSWLFNGLHFK